ncbi:MAG: type I polyketide synthase [Actinomycetota bacterium]|nr:type I polyketide synthase [Actinomycetota bacterium]
MGVFVEVGPAAVLSPMVAECLAAEPEDAQGSVVVPLVRADSDEVGSVLAGAGRLWAAGVEVDWAATMPTAKAGRARRVELPTYPFQRQRYWLDATPATSGSPHAHGLSDTHHPLLNAALAVAGGEGLVLTGRVALAEQPWLADHAVHDRVLLPGTALLDLALAAARTAGCDRVDELTLGAALVLPEQGAVQLQAVVDGPDADGTRPIRVYARPEVESGDADLAAWTQHAAGTLSSAETQNAPHVPGGPVRSVEAAPIDSVPADWPPAGDPVEVAELDARLSAAGFEYGPAFQGIRALWQRDGEVSAEVELTGQAGNFGVHPALLDAALHPMAMLLAPADGPVLPFNWQGVRLHRSGASALRVTLSAVGSDRVRVLATDEQGRLVLTAEALTVRAISVDQLPAATPRRTGALYRLSWLEVSPEPARNRTTALVGSGADADYPDLDALFAGAAAIPELVAVRLDGSAAGARQLCADTVALVQRWLAEQRCESSRLVLVTRGAVLARPGDEIDPALAAVWGLVRCAQAEHPDRISLIDLDDEIASLDALDNPREPQLAIRGNAVLAPRLREAELSPAEAPAPDPAGTVLITGGTGALGAAVARQLAGRPGVEELLLVSRRGPQAPGAPELIEELQARGARVRVAAVDVADRAALAELLSEIPAERPLTMVLHAAGVLSDAVFDAVTDEQLAAVFAAKVTAAANLHELTAQLPLSAFVLFSSFAGLTGSAGQASYGAANAYLDALAEQRRAAGLAGLSLAWGWWEQEAGMTGQLSTADRARLARSHVRALRTDSALALLDTALAAGTDAVLAPVRLDLARLATVAEPAAMLRGLVPPAAASRPVSQEQSLTDRLAELAGPQRSAAVLDFVRSEVGLVLGFADPAGVDVGKQFSELGFDSLMAVELRNRLRSGSGTELPATLVFDYPSPAEVAGRLASLLDVAEADPATALLGDLERIEQALSELDEASSNDRSRITLKLRSLMTGWQNGGTATTSNEPKVELHSATDDDLFSLVEDLGRS